MKVFFGFDLKFTNLLSAPIAKWGVSICAGFSEAPNRDEADKARHALNQQIGKKAKFGAGEIAVGAGCKVDTGISSET